MNRSVGRPGDDLDPHPGSDRRGDRVGARIRYPRHPGLADHRDPAAGRERLDELAGPPGLVALEVRDHLAIGVARPQRVDVRQQEPRRAGVLGGDQVRLAEDPRRAQRQILEVADRRADDVQRAGH
jgi:hypothetical protein